MYIFVYDLFTTIIQIYKSHWTENCVACFIMSQTIRVGNFVIEQDIFYNFIVHIANNMSTLYTTNL